MLLTIVVIWFGGAWLKNNYGQDDSNQWLVMNQFLTLLRWAIVGLFVFSIVTALGSWLFFLQQLRNKKVGVQMQLGDGQQAEAGSVPLSITLNGFVLRPPLGNIRARLIFSEKILSDAIVLDANFYKKREFLRQGITGTGITLLHDRGIYDVENVQIQFYDMFSFVALPCMVPVTRQLFTVPKQLKETTVKAQPNTTEEQKHRIDIPKRVEGEYISYKEFESGDNIRRIVWKIYAKSGQLVVRVPETMDPYASHLYFYVSFYNGLNAVQGAFEIELLNAYKDKVRNFFEGLKKNGFEVRMPQDQEVPKLPGVSEKKNELFQISAASWQKINPPATFVQPGKTAFVCLSAFTPVKELELLLAKLPLAVPVVVVQLSDAIPSPFQMKVADIFFRPEKQPVDKLRRPWFVSTLRVRLQKNEEELQKLLRHRGNGWVVKAMEVE